MFRRLCSSDRLVLYSLENEGIPLFFQHYDSVYVPTLRLVHKCNSLIFIDFNRHYLLDPNILPFVKVDGGAIRSITNGADVMAPGLTSPVSVLPEHLKPDSFVVRSFYLLLKIFVFFV
jgi:predicted RNA-binding protein (TIGR00451 family)